MKIKKFFAALVALTIIFTGLAADGSRAGASSLTGSEVEAPIVVDGDLNIPDLIPGETVHVRIPIRSRDINIQSPKASITVTPADSPFIISEPVLTNRYDVKADTIPVNDITYVDFDIRVKETAQISSYRASLIITGLEYIIIGDPTISKLDFDLKVLQEKVPAQLTISNVLYTKSLAGSDTELIFTVRNEGELKAFNTYMTIDYTDTGIVERYSTKRIKIGDLEKGSTYKASLPLTILADAAAGRKTLKANFEYKDSDGKSIKSSYDISFNVTKVDVNAPDLDIVDISYKKGIKQGDEFELTAVIENSGKGRAEDIKVSLAEGNAAFIKNFIAEYIKASDIATGNKTEVKIPLIVNKTSEVMNELKLNIEYKDSQGTTIAKTKSLYIEVVQEKEKDKEPEEEKRSSLIVSGVKQSPEQPVAGGEMEISFDLKNKGTLDINELKISLEDLMGSTFIPVESEPYLYIEKLSAGETKHITFRLELSENIPEGLNNLNIGFAYEGGSAPSVKIPVLNVKNDNLGGSSKPVLLISNYEADLDELRAGSVFNLTFSIRNTHSSVDAKNITVKVSQDMSQGDIFTSTQGSNTFFIDRINAGEEAQCTLGLKIKSDTKTGTYKLKVDIEYEYDGIKPNPQTNEIGEERSYDINLRVVENARPVVNNVQVYSWEGMVQVGMPAFLSFEFYNMGKSTLNNVMVRVGGDFTQTGGEMSILGNVDPGNTSYSEFEVIPNIEGMAHGILTITYEDSNGDEQTFTTEFDTMVNSAQIYDPGMDGGMDGGMDVFNPIPETKKEILKPWMFIVLNVVIFIVFIPVTRAIIIGIYKNKLRRKEEANL